MGKKWSEYRKRQVAMGRYKIVARKYYRGFRLVKYTDGSVIAIKEIGTESHTFKKGGFTVAKKYIDRKKK